MWRAQVSQARCGVLTLLALGAGLLAGCGDPAPSDRIEVVAPAVQHLFEEPLLAAEYAPGAFAPDVAEVLATGTVWVMDERLVTAQLKLASPPFSKRRVYRASPRFRMDGRQRRVPLDEPYLFHHISIVLYYW